MKIIEFFVDAHNVEAYNHVMETISIGNAADADMRFNTVLVNCHKDDGAYYFHLKGSWDAYRMFLRTPNVDLNQPANAKYCYSLSHYEE